MAFEAECVRRGRIPADMVDADLAEVGFRGQCCRLILASCSAKADFGQSGRV